VFIPYNIQDSCQEPKGKSLHRITHGSTNRKPVAPTVVTRGPNTASYRRLKRGADDTWIYCVPSNDRRRPSAECFTLLQLPRRQIVVVPFFAFEIPSHPTSLRRISVSYDIMIFDYFKKITKIYRRTSVGIPASASHFYDVTTSCSAAVDQHHQKIV
jgi:hypothetical protein